MDEIFRNHQIKTSKKDFDISYLVLGLCGEVGELANEIKKLHRDDDDILHRERRNKIELELGDIMWYYYGILNKIGLNNNDILKRNIEKIVNRNFILNKNIGDYIKCQERKEEDKKELKEDM